MLMAISALAIVTGLAGILDNGITISCVTHHMKTPNKTAVSSFTFKMEGNVLVNQKKKNVKDMAIK